MEQNPLGELHEDDLPVRLRLPLPPTPATKKPATNNVLPFVRKEK